MGLRLKAVAVDPLRGDAFLLPLIVHFVVDVGVGTFVRGSAVSTFCDGHFVHMLSVIVGCDGYANDCCVHFNPVGLLWARDPGEDAKRPFCQCCASWHGNAVLPCPLQRMWLIVCVGVWHKAITAGPAAEFPGV